MVVERGVTDSQRIELAAVHCHLFYAVYWIHEGRGIHSIDFCDYEIQSDRVFLMRPEQVHVMRPEGAIRYSALQFTEEYAHLFTSTDTLPTIADLTDPMEIVTIKGFGSGLGALAIAFAVGEHLPDWQHLAVILLLGYVAYGLSIYCYTYAQRTIGAAKTSTYYALAPFIGALLSIFLLGEPLTPLFIVATVIMAVGCWIAAK